jgi:hypothetical protein
MRGDAYHIRGALAASSEMHTGTDAWCCVKYDRNNVLGPLLVERWLVVCKALYLSFLFVF